MTLSYRAQAGAGDVSTAPDGNETEIADAAAQFLSEVMPLARLHDACSADLSADLRGQLGEMGWFGLALPETSGGSGLSAVEHALFFREAGRQCGPVDLLAQALATFFAEGELRNALLRGERGVALVAKDGARVRLLGSPAATLALDVDLSGARLFEVGAFAAQARPSLDPATSMGIADIAAVRPLAEVDGSEIWRMGQLGTAAMLVGIAEAALDLIVEYAKVRETFGRKIGAYQAVRHPCADMALRVEAARCQLWYAAAAIKEGRADAHVHLDAAKHLANQAAVANADTNIQLHGGIGVTDEHNAHLLLKHAHALVETVRRQARPARPAADAQAGGLTWTCNIPTPIRIFAPARATWLSANVPTTPRPAQGPGAAQFDRDWQRKMYDHGWAGVAWPKEFGGLGLSGLQQVIWYEELARARAPHYINTTYIALMHAGPTVDRARHRGAESPFISPASCSGEALVVPGLFRTQCRLRPRLAQDPRRGRWRSTSSSPAPRCGPPTPSMPTIRNC